jgi:ADP-ribose pyrophosphatase YjhB (NUDIX family)
MNSLYLQNNICLNCRKAGHHSKNCVESKTSFGIICFYIDKEININNKYIQQYITTNPINYDFNNFTQYYNNIKVLMIRRRNSLNYIEFLRGKYNYSNKYNVNKLFKLMSREENLKIRTYDFDYLWKELWINTYNNKKFIKEYKSSKKKFDYLKECMFYDLLSDNNLSDYTEPEWEFPKGKRNMDEDNLNCAKREFCEETNLNIDDINIYNSAIIEEEFKGTNNLNYKNIYYFANTDNLSELTNTDAMNYEIGDIKWVTINEAINMIRPYYISKIKLIYQIYLIIFDLIYKATHSKYIKCNT